MAKIKYDVVVEAVHYKENGQIDWVRAYQRRGPTFSDRVMLNRAALIDLLKAGKKLVAGQRVHQMAGTFTVTDPIHLTVAKGQEIIVTKDRQAGQDRLQGVPVL